MSVRGLIVPAVAAAAFPLAVGWNPSAAAPVQVGTLVIEDTVPNGALYDPGFGVLHGQPALSTQTVVGAPVNLISSFSGTSGDTDTVVDINDIGLDTEADSFFISRLGRFNGTTNAGGVQWEIDLSPLDTYLSSNSLSLSSLYIGLDLTFNDLTSEADIYLSYTDAAQSITLTDFATDSGGAATDWTNPAQGNLGNIANGTHEVIALNVSGAPYQSTIDLLALYNAGIRDVNLVFAHESFWGNGDNVQVLSASGVYIDTAPIPEPSGIGLIILGAAPFARRRRHR